MTIRATESTRMRTPIFAPAPSIMLVGVSDEIAAWCVATFQALRVLRVAHSFAASERVLATRPLVVVIGVGVSADGSLGELASDACSEVVQLHDSFAPAFIETTVREAVVRAEQRRRSSRHFD
jgi:hypothetical protein